MSTLPSLHLLSLSALARRLDLSQPRALALYKAGRLPPDFVSGRMVFFVPGRVEELRGIVASIQRHQGTPTPMILTRDMR